MEYSIEKNNTCVDRCPIDFRYKYKYRCYKYCPKEAESACEIEANYTNRECYFDDYYLNDPDCNLTLNNPQDKQKFIEKTVKGIKELRFYELILEKRSEKKNLIIRYGDEVYQIYSISNKEIIPDLTLKIKNIILKMNILMKNVILLYLKMKQIYYYMIDKMNSIQIICLYVKVCVHL